ncbi:MAG: hypothetical protein Q9162_000690 [Coniocarpon cinnabarinum]
MFEKSLFDLIRGLRNHKGNERAYIQDNIRECRREIKGQDMDLKATALLKLTYLEMFGHDMSWASFNVLEVMSSQKYPQKRVAYLAAVQSFRPDTEVLVLVENQLKKDLASPMAPTISLPLVAIPHVLNMSMANSLLADLLPRLSHSNQIIRKKTIVTLYRLALVYPETLRPTWPKIKERLQDESEEPTVTAAVVNVVCELGWRRPQDFLPLAPRLFDLLVEGNNNWMAIKIIKLFAILTPLEPRLVKKLVSPLTTIIKTTPAMSLLYEAINGIINGGILTGAGESTESDELARLCISKLRGMLAVQGDPNLRYVALLALERIVEVQPYLVSLHEDAIMECIDDRDISIRLRALDLAAGMVNAQNLDLIVDRLMKQLDSSPVINQAEDIQNIRGLSNGIEPYADSDDESTTRPAKRQPKTQDDPHMPEEYRVNVIQKILSMCSRNNYENIADFAWYITTLLALCRHVPTSSTSSSAQIPSESASVAIAVGNELQNIAIRVKSSRREAVQAAESFILDVEQFASAGQSDGANGILGPMSWIVGEFAEDLLNPTACLDALVRSENAKLPAATMNATIQALVKIFAFLAGNESQAWDAEQKTMMTLLMSKIIDFLNDIVTHPHLEIQEAGVQYLELFRLASEAVSSHVSKDDIYQPDQAPLLLCQAIPSLFKGAELNPVAPDAQRKVPMPEELHLDDRINPHLDSLLQAPSIETLLDDDNDFDDYYSRKPQASLDSVVPAANSLLYADEAPSYQQPDKRDDALRAIGKKKAGRQDYVRDDPFYLSGRSSSGSATPVHDILRSNNGEELDVDSIPIMELNLEDTGDPSQPSRSEGLTRSRPHSSLGRKVEILSDESIDQSSGDARPPTTSRPFAQNRSVDRGFLQVDSSQIGSLSLSDTSSNTKGKRSTLDVERQEAEEAEMAQAMKEVERLRLEMQRAQERIEAKTETTVIKKKKKKVASREDDGAPEPETPKGVSTLGSTADHSGETELARPEHVTEKKKKKKKKGTAGGETAAEELDSQDPVKPRKKKKRREMSLEESSALQ